MEETYKLLNEDFFDEIDKDVAVTDELDIIEDNSKDDVSKYKYFIMFCCEKRDLSTYETIEEYKKDILDMQKRLEFTVKHMNCLKVSKKSFVYNENCKEIQDIELYNDNYDYGIFCFYIGFYINIEFKNETEVANFIKFIYRKDKAAFGTDNCAMRHFCIYLNNKDMHDNVHSYNYKYMFHKHLNNSSDSIYIEFLINFINEICGIEHYNKIMQKLDYITDDIMKYMTTRKMFPETIECTFDGKYFGKHTSNIVLFERNIKSDRETSFYNTNDIIREFGEDFLKRKHTGRFYYGDGIIQFIFSDIYKRINGQYVLLMLSGNVHNSEDKLKHFLKIIPNEKSEEIIENIFY